MNLHRLTLTNSKRSSDGLKISIVHTTAGTAEKQDGSLRRDARKARDALTIRLLEQAIEGIRGGEYEEVGFGRGTVSRRDELIVGKP